FNEVVDDDNQVNDKNRILEKQLVVSIFLYYVISYQQICEEEIIESLDRRC
ncbi:11004_t:CDS:1, partial [Entrophospora sp. SA101]